MIPDRVRVPSICTPVSQCPFGQNDDCPEGAGWLALTLDKDGSLSLISQESSDPTGLGSKQGGVKFWGIHKRGEGVQGGASRFYKDLEKGKVVVAQVWGKGFLGTMMMKLKMMMMILLMMMMKKLWQSGAQIPGENWPTCAPPWMMLEVY